MENLNAIMRVFDKVSDLKQMEFYILHKLV